MDPSWRLRVNTIISDVDLRLTYLPLWKKLVDEKPIVDVMMNLILLVIRSRDHICASGNDINFGPEFEPLHQAVTHCFVHVNTINLAISRSLLSRFVCGNFDPISGDPYASIPYSTVDSLEHKLLTKEIVTESVVLLQNPQQILPSNIRKLKQIALIGPSARDITVQALAYHGTTSQWITTLDEIQAIASNYNASVVSTYDAQRRSPDQQDYPYAI